MPRHYDYFWVGSGDNAQTVGYSAKERGGYLAVVFLGPGGNRLEKMTRSKRPDANFTEQAARIIAATYSVVANPKHIGWDDALAEVVRTAPDLRPATFAAFRKALKQLRATFDQDDKTPKKPQGPADITPELAKSFRKLLASTRYTRGNSKITRERSGVTVSYYLRSLSALWSQFKDLGYVSVNPWGRENCRRPQVEQKQKFVPTEEDISRFFAWVRAKYPEWERLDCLLKLKLLSGCRTADIVQLRSDQLHGGKLVFKPSQTKTKTGRSVPLPDDLFRKLRALAGKVYLWDGWQAECKRFRPSANDHKLEGDFDTNTVYVVLCNIFREFSDAHPSQPRLTPHAFRRRAITVMVMATQSVDLTAQALGLNPQTARTYYLDAARAFNTEDAFRLATAKLLPKEETQATG